MLSYKFLGLFGCLIAAIATDTAKVDVSNSKEQAVSPWEESICEFEQWDAKNTPPRNAILFVGSSSIRGWKTAQCFPELTVINRGFGGSTIPDVLEFTDRIVVKYHPKVIVFYCGDNDIAGNTTPETVRNNFVVFAEGMAQQLPNTPIIFISIKPSGSRWSLWPRMQEANKLIKTYCEDHEKLYWLDLGSCLLGDDGRPDDSLYSDDRLHLSDKGYAVWTNQLRVRLQRILEKPCAATKENDGR
ncbi:MAG: hypothetical protein JW709_10225 [Sedimentisphaerales bacterium]|nr:hypothetical protein [Sedimentisphaerales bacterium]